jgi:hypothetical protein
LIGVGKQLEHCPVAQALDELFHQVSVSELVTLALQEQHWHGDAGEVLGPCRGRLPR